MSAHNISSQPQQQGNNKKFKNTEKVARMKKEKRPKDKSVKVRPKLTEEQVQLLNEKKKQALTLKEEIKMKEEQLHSIKLEMKSIRQSNSACATIYEPVPIIEQKPLTKEEMYNLKIHKKEEKKALKLEKRLFKTQRKMEKISFKKERKERKCLLNQAENNVETVQQDNIVASEPTLPVVVTIEPLVEQPIVVTTVEPATITIDEKLVLKFQKKEEKKMKKQMIKAQRQLERLAQKQERKERKLMKKHQHSISQLEITY